MEDDASSSTICARLYEIAEKIQTAWKPHPVLTVNNAVMRLVKFKGRFSDFHVHEIDECYVVLDGELLVETRDGRPQHLRNGDAFVVRAGVVHRPIALPHATVMLIT